MRKRSLGLFIALLLTAGFAFGQGKALCINEVMTSNTSSVVDDYGLHQPWIEIFNTSFSNVDIKTCFLTTNKAVLNPNLSAPQRIAMMYMIPRGDVNSVLPPRQFTTFWADGFPKRGNNHTNFTLVPNKANWIALYDANGITLIDSVTIPPIKANCSYALKMDGIKADGWAVMGEKANTYVTPCTNNITLDTNAKITKFKEKDPDGIAMALTAMSVVFFALILLYSAFKITGKIGENVLRKNAMKARGITDKKEAIEKSVGHESGDHYAAIGMALYEYQNNVHDVEETLLTIQRTKRNYSPWSSKIYSLRHVPKR
jgi:Na+-transporting methylmalonyl-CoA/oxaloacetate decarboxylase gamma subunit